MKKHVCLSLLLAVACSDPPPPVTPCLALEEAARYGSAEANGSAGTADHSVLGDIRGAIISPDGEVLVLDRYAHQIVGFDEDGAVTRIIRGGNGEGPGEFRLPMHLTATDRGMAVIDYDLRRTTEFSWSGELLRVVHLETPAPWQQVLWGDTAWITYSDPGSSALPVYITVDLVHGWTSAGPTLDPEDQAYGLAVGSTGTSDGALLVTTARPGVWMEFTNDNVVRRGSPLFPQDTPPVTERTGPRQSRVTPSQHTASGLVAIGDTFLVQGIFSLLRPFDWNEPPGRDEGVRSIAIYHREGGHLATLTLPPSAQTRFMSADSRTGRLFVPVTDPYPQLIEYRLATCEKED